MYFISESKSLCFCLTGFLCFWLLAAAGYGLELPAPGWEFPGHLVGRAKRQGLGKGDDLSRVQCHVVHPPEPLFSPGELLVDILEINCNS